MNKRQIDGARGEALAAKYILDKGYAIKDKNYRANGCEIDIIAERDGYTVFFEVKARKNDKFGLGRESVTAEKQRNIIKAAQTYLISNKLMDTPVRFDVIEVHLTNGSCAHIENAFDA